MYKTSIEKKVEVDIFKIKSLYNQKFDETIENLKSKREEILKKLAYNPKSKYYNQRITQIDDELSKTIEEKEILLKKLSYSNINRDELKSHLAVLGQNSGGIYEEQNISPFQEAINGIFDLKLLNFQKIIGYILAFAVEVSILLLAILGVLISKNNIKENSTNLTINEHPTIYIEKLNNINNDIIEENNNINNDTINEKYTEERNDTINKNIENTPIEENNITENKNIDNKENNIVNIQENKDIINNKQKTQTKREKNEIILTENDIYRLHRIKKLKSSVNYSGH